MKNLAAALVAAQAEMPSIHKGGQNPHFRSKYVTLDDLIEATRPILNKHGIVVTQGGGMTDHGHPVLLTQLTHAESGEQMTWGMPLFLTKEDMQGMGSAITYARRYAWAAALGIASDEDDDANQASSAATKAPVASDGVFRFTSGKYKGASVAETDPAYLDWYLESGPKQEVKDAIVEWRLKAGLDASGTALVDDPDYADTADIPF